MLLYPQVQWPKRITSPLCYRIYLKQHLRVLVLFQKLEDLSLVREHADSENTQVTKLERTLVMRVSLNYIRDLRE